MNNITYCIFFLRFLGVWEPDLIIICAGYDALSQDTVATTNLNSKDYGKMSERLCEYLSEICIEDNNENTNNDNDNNKLCTENKINTENNNKSKSENNNNNKNKMKVPGIMLGLEGGYYLGEGGESGNLSDAVVETVRALIRQKYI